MSQRNENKPRRLDITGAFLKQLKALPPKQCKQVTLATLSLASIATPHDSSDLTGYPPWRRVDIGEFRVIYRFDAETVYIAYMGKRNDGEVYRWLNRR